MIAGVLLAAGHGRRFGANKLLAPLNNGRPMLTACIDLLQPAVEVTVVVVHPADAGVKALLQDYGGLVLCDCPAASYGMGHSLACGVGASANASGWVVALADMPYLKTDTVAHIVQRLREGAALVAPSYRGRRGHPVGFAQQFRPELLALRGDQGARVLLQQQADRLETWPCDDPGILRDVDTPADLGGA